MSQATAAVTHELEHPAFSVEWRKLMLWLFIVTDALLFSSFLASYMFTRLASDSGWPDQTAVFNLGFITAMTFALITSSCTMACAVKASGERDVARARRYLALTILIGLVFLGMQAFEWSHFIADGARLDQNPWGIPAFSSYFFAMTGLHGTHVLIGVVILVSTWLHTTPERIDAEKVELCGLYWHFVDLVWVFIFGCFYLL